MQLDIDMICLEIRYTFALNRANRIKHITISVHQLLGIICDIHPFIFLFYLEMFTLAININTSLYMWMWCTIRHTFFVVLKDIAHGKASFSKISREHLCPVEWPHIYQQDI